MKQCSHVIFQAADNSQYYWLVWDETLELALLSRGACTVRQGGQAYTFEGAPSPPAIAAAPIMLTTDPTAALAAIQDGLTKLAAQPDLSPALTALQTAVTALPQAADQTAAFAAIKVAISAVLTAVLKLPDPTAALATLAKQQVAAGVATSIDVIVPDSGGAGPVDVGQVIYIPNPKVTNPPDPTFTINGKVVVGTVATNVTT